MEEFKETQSKKRQSLVLVERLEKNIQNNEKDDWEDTSTDEETSIIQADSNLLEDGLRPQLLYSRPGRSTSMLHDDEYLSLSDSEEEKLPTLHHSIKRRKKQSVQSSVQSSTPSPAFNIQSDTILISSSSCESSPAKQYPASKRSTPFQDVSSQPEDHKYYMGDTNLPVYKHGLTSGIMTRDLLPNLLWPPDQLATRVPLHVQKNVLFLVRLSSLGHPEDLLSDGCGVWVQTNTKTTYVKTSHNEIYDIEQTNYGNKGTFKIQRKSYRHKQSKDFHRILVFLKKMGDSTEMYHHVAAAQYYFDDEEHEIEVSAHGNSRENKPFYRTFKSTSEKMKMMATQKPKDAVHSILEESGGIRSISAPGEHLRDRKQVSNMRYRTKTRDNKDPLLEVMDMCKLQAKHPETAFLREVIASPELKLFLSTNQQMEDIDRFCTNPKQFSILGVDATYNIGDYFLTLTTYRHLMLSTKKGTEPVFIGPALLHQRKLFDSYFSLPSLMLEYKPSLQKVLVYGSDGEKNITDAFDTCFTFSSHLLCDIHMKDNVKAKLLSLGITADIAKIYMYDIFGKELGTEKEPGLVDCFSADSFDRKLEDLKPEWTQRHSNGQAFLEYFVTYKADLMKKSMTADLRAMAGLGFPPKMYNQNANECANSVIKRGLKLDKLDIKQGVLHLQQLIQRQQEEVRLAFIGRGELKVKNEYQNLMVKEEEYYKMSKQQKEKIEAKFSSGKVKGAPNQDNHDNELSFENALEKEIVNLSISAEDSQILNIPFSMVEDMFAQASRIMESRDNIVAVPGSNSKLYLVLSSNTPDPHHVRIVGTSGQLSCDKNCIRWMTNKICSHTIAAAEFIGNLGKFLKWYNTNCRQPSLTNLANADMPQGRGKKASKSTQRRKGYSNPNKRRSEVYSYTSGGREADPKPSLPNPGFGAYIVTLLKACHENTSVCYGCKNRFKEDGYPDPPADLIVVTKGQREFTREDGKQMSKLGNMYFHLNEACIRKFNSYFIACLLKVPDDVKCILSDLHKNYLENIGVSL